jgi:tryptophan-rich sensory protein
MPLGAAALLFSPWLSWIQFGVLLGQSMTHKNKYTP